MTTSFRSPKSVLSARKGTEEGGGEGGEEGGDEGAELGLDGLEGGEGVSAVECDENEAMERVLFAEGGLQFVEPLRMIGRWRRLRR